MIIGFIPKLKMLSICLVHKYNGSEYVQVKKM